MKTYATPSSPFSYYCFPWFFQRLYGATEYQFAHYWRLAYILTYQRVMLWRRKKANHKSRFFCAAQMSRTYNSQKHFFLSPFSFIFSWSLAFTRKEMPSTASSSDSTIVVLLLFLLSFDWIRPMHGLLQWFDFCCLSFHPFFGLLGYRDIFLLHSDAVFYFLTLPSFLP